MRFFFSAPFRTDINLNSINAAGSPASVEERLLHATKATSLSEGMNWEVPPRRDDPRKVRVYSGIDMDSIPHIAMPLARLCISDQAVKSLVGSQALGKESVIEQTLFHDCAINYFDNTIAILTLDVTFKCPGGKEVVFDYIECWSNKLCSLILRGTREYEKRFSVELLGGNRARKPKKIFLKRGEFIVYSDRNDLKKSNESDSDGALWVSRIYFDENDLSGDTLTKWTQNPDLKSRTTDVGLAKVALCVGNSVVFGQLSPPEEKSLKKSFSICTYFFVLYFVLDANLKAEFLRISKPQHISSATISQSGQVKYHIEFIESEFGDTIIGLQGLRKVFATELLDTWDFSAIEQSVARKKDLVEKRIESALRDRQGSHRRILESVLAAIAGVAVLEFVLTLFSFAKDQETAHDAILGLVDVVKYLSVDLVLYTVFGFIIFFVYLTGRRR